MKPFKFKDFNNDGYTGNKELVLFHISTKSKLKSLESRIPLSRGKKENHVIKRTCFSPSINGCISAVWPTRSVYYVYATVKPTSELSLMVPTVGDCYDSRETKEVWCLDETVDLKLIGCIHINVRKFLVERKYNYISYHYDIIKHRWKIKDIKDNEYADIMQAAFDYQDTYIKEISL